MRGLPAPVVTGGAPHRARRAAEAHEVRRRSPSVPEGQRSRSARKRCRSPAGRADPGRSRARSGPSRAATHEPRWRCSSARARGGPPRPEPSEPAPGSRAARRLPERPRTFGPRERNERTARPWATPEVEAPPDPDGSAAIEGVDARLPVGIGAGQARGRRAGTEGAARAVGAARMPGARAAEASAPASQREPRRVPVERVASCRALEDPCRSSTGRSRSAGAGARARERSNETAGACVERRRGGADAPGTPRRRRSTVRSAGRVVHDEASSPPAGHGPGRRTVRGSPAEPPLARRRSSTRPDPVRGRNLGADEASSVMPASGRSGNDPPRARTRAVLSSPLRRLHGEAGTIPSLGRPEPRPPTRPGPSGSPGFGK